MTFMQFITAISMCPRCGSNMYVEVDVGCSRLHCFDGCEGYFERANTDSGTITPVEYKLRKE